MLDQILFLKEQALQNIETCGSIEELEELRINLIGRKGRVTELLKSISTVDISLRRELGIEANKLKNVLSDSINSQKQAIMDSASLVPGDFDITIPGQSPRSGGLHPITQMMYDLNDAFLSLGFEVFDGYEITSELYAFDHLNFPPDHPARESMDTYWLDTSSGKSGAERLCLRPHLTGESIRRMQRGKPPFRFVYPGCVFRNEATDPRHERAFFQYEALMVDRHIPFSSGQLLIQTILATVFGTEVKTRMRAGFFPFVEPGFEIDMQCLVCNGGGCRVCKHVGWLEIMPGGPPHPNVMRAAGLDPDEWSGFYINVGLDRLVMMRYGIDDIRLFHSCDLRFLNQFS